MKPFLDLFNLSEDDRIAMIAHQVVDHNRTIAFMVDTEGPDGNEKADRYMKKLTEKYPTIREIKRCRGPVPGVITVQVGPIVT